MMRKIWFKKDCTEWIKNGKKTTTFRHRKHVGEYEVVEGSRFKNKPIGLQVRLTPIREIAAGSDEFIKECYATEGDFKTPDEFTAWLKANRLYDKYSGAQGWLHEISVIKKQ